MESVHLQLPAELLARIDAERGMIARNRWIRWAAEQALGGVASGNSSSVASPRGTGGFQEDRATPSSTPAEQPRESRRSPGQVRESGATKGSQGTPAALGAAHYRQHVPGPSVEGVRSSSAAKRDVRPVPKKGEK